MDEDYMNVYKVIPWFGKYAIFYRYYDQIEGGSWPFYTRGEAQETKNSLRDYAIMHVYMGKWNQVQADYFISQATAMIEELEEPPEPPPEEQKVPMMAIASILLGLGFFAWGIS